MEELQDASIHHTAAKLINTMKTLKNYEPLYQNVQRLVCSPTVDRNDMCNTLEDAVKNAGIETEIRNILFYLVRNSLKIAERGSQLNLNDPLSYLRRAGVQWDRRVRKSLNAMCSELKMACQGQPRISTDREELLNKWDEMSNYNIDLANYRPVYAPKDILDVLLSLKGPTKGNENIELVQVPKWEFSHISLPVKNLFELVNGNLLNNTGLQNLASFVWPEVSGSN